MENLLKRVLLQIIDDIDAGNSNITQEEEIEFIRTIRRFTDKTERLSKYQACKLLNISRATFDNYIKEGKIPKGVKQQGFKELSWNKKELLEFIRKHKNAKV